MANLSKKIEKELDERIDNILEFLVEIKNIPPNDFEKRRKYTVEKVGDAEIYLGELMIFLRKIKTEVKK